ncbi:hypothetical protein HCU40_06670 [Pseudanabaena biceps]|nr:hypothetical protein [Pseudanabaena biceps]
MAYAVRISILSIFTCQFLECLIVKDRNFFMRLLCMDAPLLLEFLLKDIKPEYALSLFAQCQKFAMLDGIMTPEEV